MAEAALPGLADALALGLRESEYRLICERLGRAPNTVELAMLSLMWSEHCAYKHSKRLLKTLPTEGEHLVMGPGENAGAVDIGDGLICAFKVESHNHPSAVEPFQGAATGVGGILRDIFAVGARPVAVLDSLRFGEPDAPRARYLLDGAVSGIGHYGNSVGVPTIGGEVYFEGPYADSCLVNAMALGIAPRSRLMSSAAAGPGNLLVLFGATTGRDGIGGASVLASAELDLGGEGKRPSVQVGDPFEGKKLMECSLQLLDERLVLSLQDLGAAGLTSSASEMASKGGVGLEIDLVRVPLREADMEPFEIMVSESQERMLCVVAPERLPAVLAVCESWEIEGAAIGVVTDSGHVRVLRGATLREGTLEGGSLLADLPVGLLVDDVPTYGLDPQRPQRPLYPDAPATLAADASPEQMLLALLASPNIASREPLFEQYDSLVQSRTVRRPGAADAAVLAIEPLRGGGATAPLPGLAVSIDCNGRRVAADPYRGTIEAVLECAANLACVGAEPLGLTNNLNFGNPEKPQIAWQLEEAVRGLGDACRALSVPVVGGNVSLYNEGPAGPIYPTPVIGMVGRLPDVARAGRLGFAASGDTVALVGPFSPSPVASELAKLQGRPLPLPHLPPHPRPLPHLDFPDAMAAIRAVREAVRSGEISSAHDIAEGGLAVALAECCLAGGVGATVAIPAEIAEDPLARLFGEAPGGFLLSGPADALQRLAEHTPLRTIGTVGGATLAIEAGGAGSGARIELALSELAGAHGMLAGLLG